MDDDSETTDCDHGPDELVGDLVADEGDCDECDRPATHDLGYALVCCAHYREDVAVPTMSTPPYWR